MEPITTIHGRMVPLDRADVDTDQIMPKQFLKRIERTGFGELVFADWRQDPDFVLNDERYSSGTVLVSGPNFGSGSSREHAPWGLQQYGFEALIAPSFADIFASNCAKIGLLTVELPEQICRRLLEVAVKDPSLPVTINLPEQTLLCAELDVSFEIDPHRKHMLVGGLDEIELTAQLEDQISAYEDSRPRWAPVTTG